MPPISIRNGTLVPGDSVDLSKSRARILLTGATGLIGSAVRRRLGGQFHVVTLGRRADCDIHADLSEPNSFSRVELGKIDGLIHCAGVVDEDFVEGPDRAFRAAVSGAEALVSAAVGAGAHRLVYVSSAHIYGPMVGRKDESSPVDPRSDYALAHYVTEQVFRRHVSESVGAVALRPCAVFGDLPDPSSFRRWSLIPFSFPRDAVMNGRVTIKSSGLQRRNFVGTEDIAETAVQWLTSKVGGWSAINPVGEKTLTVFDFAKLCAEATCALGDREVTVDRQSVSGPTPGDNFEYESLHEIARGRQDLRDATAKLIATLGGE